MIVSVEELRDAMSGVSLTADQWSDAEAVLEELQSELETHLNRPIEQGTFVETVRTVDDGYVPLSKTPIASVTSVVYNSATVTGWVLSDGGLYYGSMPDVLVTVTYVAGLVDPIAVRACKRAIIRAAKREIQNNHDDALTVKDLETSDNPQLPEGFQEDELKKLNRWRRRVVL